MSRGYTNRGYSSGNGYAYPQSRSYYQQPANFNGVVAQGYEMRGNSVKKKKSGAKELRGRNKNGEEYFGIKAWFVRQNTGMVSITAFENSKSTHFDTQDGLGGVTLMFEVRYRNTGIKQLCVASYFFGSGKAYLKDLGLMVSTKAPNGGYAGFIPSEKVKREFRR